MTTSHPFAPLPSPQSFLETLGGGEALRRLDNGLGTREPFLLVTGEPGMGKTVIANEAVARWGSRVTAAFLALPMSTSGELLEEILRRFGAEAPEGAGRPALVARLEAALADIAGRGQVALIVVDDAHHLSRELLEELRLLVTAAQRAGRPLEVLLAGLPALEAMLDDPALAALRQRVSVCAKLEPLSAGETRRYIRHRVAATGDERANLFPRKTCAEIASLSGGVPRRINTLAAEALRLAETAGQPTVEPAHVRAAASTLSGVLPKSEVEDPADDERGAGPAAAPARTRATKPGTPPAPAPPAAAPNTPARARTSEPPATPAPRRIEPPANAPEPAAAGAQAIPRRLDDAAASEHEPPTSHDSREWVARFIGDRGPVRISSQVTAGPAWIPDEPEADEAIPVESGGRPPAPSAESRGAPPPGRRRGGDLRVAAIVGLVTIGVIATALAGFRAIGSTRSRAAATASDATTAHVAPPAASTNSPVAPVATPKRSNATGPRGAVEPAPHAEPVIPKGPYTLDTDVRLDLWSALDERARIQELTGIEGWVVPVGAPDAGEYGVVLGIFKSHPRAVAAADMLMKSRTLRKVTVVPLPPRGTRQ